MALLDEKDKKDDGGWFDRFPWNLLRIGRSGGGHAFGPLTVWVWWERYTNWREKVQEIGPDHFLKYSISHYSGDDRVLADGTELRKGDPIILLHYNNVYITSLIAKDQFSPWKGLRMAGLDINWLEERVVRGDLGHVRAMYGITLFVATGPRLGMETNLMPHTFHARLVRYFMIGMIALYHPKGWKHAAKTGADLWPAEVWIGLETMKQKIAKLDAKKQKATPEPSVAAIEQHATD